MYQKSGKRIFDMTVAVTGLTILLPLFIFITIILWFHFRRKPFFCQPRPGKDEEIFILFKFRSMHGPTDSLHLSAKSSLGNFLRKTSLDELPQLWNVLRGEMSIVGPRPLLKEYLPLYNPKQRLRHTVLPGITGLAQVKGRNCIGWEEKFSHDLWYVQNQSFLVDLQILLCTFKKVLMRDGIRNPHSPHAEKFKGSLEV